MREARRLSRRNVAHHRHRRREIVLQHLVGADAALVAAGARLRYFGTKIPSSSAQRQMPASPAWGNQREAAIASIICRASFGATAKVAFAAFSLTCMFG